MYAPAYRFPDEPDDPVIPPRAASTTDPTPGEPLDLRFARERAEATAQIAYIRQILAQIRATAQKALS